ncbi:helix-turn-helix domain-containing protein [Methylobacillus caricis]|uniref:helix-turn-helix domain-containing protein n=1 Tax=Methylobacillus caricis TaxID=1971611 RepID=UPI001D001497|nr:helix-turn-helix transcriptional regulator [Methylobacillus caricis]MCB5188870.1 helix-turn-helix domain-containing protein [Methylobacillus caricis]
MAERLRNARKLRGLRLVEVEKILRIDVGQLSKFETGKFKLVSKNLQKYCNFLQINAPLRFDEPDSLIQRFSRVLLCSPQHAEAAAHMVALLEAFDTK